jgi:type VI secretion system protein ImpH
MTPQAVDRPPKPARKDRRLSLLGTLMNEPARFSFDAAVAIMMRAAGSADPATAISFHAPVGLGFVPADVLSVTRAGAGFHATTGLAGLTGPSGVLPRPYTEMVNAEHRRRSPALAAVLDLLAQLPVAQFAAAGIKYRPHRAADAAACAGYDVEPAKFGSREALLAFIGDGLPASGGAVHAQADARLYYAGAFAAQPRSADHLSAILSDWLGHAVDLEQFAGSWLSLGRDQMSRLPSCGRSGQFCQLGVDAAIGARAWDIQSQIVLHIGPLTLSEFEKFLPGEAELHRLVSITRAYLGDQIDFVVNPVLAADAVPPLALEPSNPPRLGANSWLPTSNPRTDDAIEARFRPSTSSSPGVSGPPGALSG